MNYTKINLKGFPFWCLSTEKDFEPGKEVDIELKWGGTDTRIIAKKVGTKEGNNIYTLVPNNKSRNKKENRAERYVAWSTVNAQKSSDRYNANDVYRDFLSLGEPIKVGHHSEKAHRGLINKFDNNMRKSIEFSDKAGQQADRAEGITRQLESIIYLDDFDVVNRLEKKIAALEAKKESIKKHNKENPTEKIASYTLTNLGEVLRKDKKKLEAVRFAFMESVEEEKKEETAEKKDFDFSLYGAFFAFGDQQFQESKKEGVKYVSCGAGLICPKDTADKMLKDISKHK